jgi:hypothetical protein
MLDATAAVRLRVKTLLYRGDDGRRLPFDRKQQSMFHYQIAGLSVESEIELPGAIEACRSGMTEVRIRRNSAPNRLDGATASGPSWQIAGESFLLNVPNVARFLLTKGAAIDFDPETEEAMDDVRIFILGTVFGILLHQRGRIALHASAVRVNGRAALFCGSSGAGKSTLAAALAQRGFSVASDDICSVSFDHSRPPTVHPDGRQLKLWAQAVNRLDLVERRGDRVRRALEKYYVDAGFHSIDPLPLGAVYILREARPHLRPGIEQPNVVDIALLLRRNAYRPQLVRRFDQAGHYFQAAATIANAGGVFHLTRKLGFNLIGESVDMLERHWSELRLTEPAL